MKLYTIKKKYYFNYSSWLLVVTESRALQPAFQGSQVSDLLSTIVNYGNEVWMRNRENERLLSVWARENNWRLRQPGIWKNLVGKVKRGRFSCNWIT